MRQKVVSFLQSYIKYILIALICTLILVFYIRYDQIALSSDDDVQLNLIASGAFGPDSQYLIYMNIVYGWFLRLLSQWIPSVNWYLFCGLIFNLCAVISICWLVCRRMRILPSVTVTLLCMLFFSKDFFLLTQFTSNVFILAAAGCFWFLYAIRQNKKAAFLPAAVFLVLSACCRAAAFFMTIPFICVVLCVHLGTNRTILRRIKQQPRQLILPLLPFVIALTVIGADKLAYAKDPDWSYFLARVEALVEIEDRGFIDYMNHAMLYDEAGFPMETLNLIMNWLDNDPEVYSLEQLQKIAGIKRSYDPISFRISMEMFTKTAKNISARLLSGEHPPPLLCVAAILAFALTKDKKRLWMMVLYAVLIFGIYYALTCYGRLGWHVETGIWLLTFLLPFADRFAEDGTEVKSAVYAKSEKRLHLISAVLLTAFFLLCGLAVSGDPQTNRLVSMPSTVRDTAFSHGVLEYVTAHKESFFLAASPLSRGYWGAASVYDLNYANRSDFENICWLGGWFAGSPIGNYHAYEAGFTNPVRALIEQENTCLVATEDEMERIYYFLAENYREDIMYQLIHEDAGYGIWKFSVI